MRTVNMAQEFWTAEELCSEDVEGGKTQFPFSRRNAKLHYMAAREVYLTNFHMFQATSNELIKEIIAV